MASRTLPVICVSDNETLVKPIRWRTTEGPVDLTGSSFFMQVRVGVDGDLVAELSTENGRITITDAPEGRFRVQIEASELGEGDLCYDILHISAGGITKRLFDGTIEVERGTSQRT